MLSFKDRANWSPAQARGQFRQNFFPLLPAGGISGAFTQVSVHIIPSSAAGHFAEFCRMNHGPCPIVHQSTPGEVSASPIAADSDIRTDQSGYGIFQHGVHTKTVTDILDIPFDDFVAFYLGCSHSFELALTNAGLPIRHQQVDRTVPCYKTKIPCISAGTFSGNVVASMRPMPRNLVQRASDVTAVLDQVHGAPLHIGDPCWIGIEDLLHPEYDDKPNIKEGDVCMFWGCATTAMEVLTNSKLSLMISLSPTANCCTFITDLSNDAFNKMHPPKSGAFQTRAVFICERPVYGSLISDKAMELIQQLKTLDKHDALKPVIKEINGKPDEQVDSLVKAAMMLSHASSVAMVTLDDISTKGGFSVLLVIKSLMATQTKDVVLLIPEEKCPEWTNAISSCIDLKMLKKPVRVSPIETCGGSSKEDILKILRRVLSTMDGKKPDGELPSKFTALVGCDKQGGLWVESEAELMTDINAASPKTSDHTWPGEVLAAALYTLNCCPVHSRYLRRGLGRHRPLQQNEFLMTPKELRTLLSKFDVKFNTEDEEDLIGKTNMSTASTMQCLNIEA